LRRKCARFVRDHGEAIASARPEIPPGLSDRKADIWEPLLAVADLAGGKWPEVARTAAEGLSARGGDAGDGVAGGYWGDSERDGRWPRRRLVEGLNELGERPWRGVMKGGVVTESWLASTLREYGLRPRNRWVKGVQGRGYRGEELSEVLRRYVAERSGQNCLREAGETEGRMPGNENDGREIEG
jgi:Protein of unknown function (DUF3631)